MITKHPFSGVLALVVISLSITAFRPSPQEPAISISLAPVADAGGPESLEPIRGSVRSGSPQDRVVLYSHSGGVWWVQPFGSRPFTDLAADLTWQNSIHLGTEYAALLVDKSYQPSQKLEKLPAKGNGVLAVAITPGSTPRPVTIHFSGYDWEVRQLSSNWGGKLNPYDPSNAWVDQAGLLHLRIAHRDDQWSCADIGLRESLGQGSYRLAIRDLSRLEPAAAFRLYTWERLMPFNGELSVEVSRWGDTNSKNSQFVIQPSYEPNNLHRFETPSGAVTLAFHWRPGKVSFQAWRGGIGEKGRAIAEHTFVAGVPQPGDQKTHIGFCRYGNSPIPMKEPAEVIIERFQYAP